MRCLVIGYGSIGSRHGRLLHEMGHAVFLVTRRRDVPFPAFPSIADAGKSGDYDLVIIASPTHCHADDYEAAASRLQARSFVLEKPVFARLGQLPTAIPDKVKAQTHVAYNLRFHPAIAKIRELLQGKRLLSAVFYVGQYLPDWRPCADYRIGYSADRSKGGGVLRDLSHELDLACHLAGPWEKLTASGGRVSHLEITSDDVFSLLSSHERCAHVNIHVNYLDRERRRTLTINHEEGTVFLDFVANTLMVNGRCEYFVADPDISYKEQLRALLAECAVGACTLDEGLDVVYMIEAAEYAAECEEWVAR